MRRLSFALEVIGSVSTALGPLEASDQAANRVQDAAAIECGFDNVKIRGSGRLSDSTQQVRAGAELARVFTPELILTGEGRFSQERRLPYDLRQWGGQFGVGWILSEADSILATYRFDSYKVFNTGPNVDPAFLAVAGRNQVAALGLAWRHDSRDDHFYPANGLRTKLSGELAIEPLGGDYDFGRLEADVAVYATPLRGRTETGLDNVTLVEHFRTGWVENFGDTDDVPFYERYFVGGSATVRGSRTRWLTPRGLEQQFVGGEILVVNNIEARIPIFQKTFNRQLSAVAFFDAGRSYRRFSEIGDFGYGVGGGIRYVVQFWKLHGVVRADYGINLDSEGDNSKSRIHLTIGVPF